MYEELPVLITSNYSSLTAEMLEQLYEVSRAAPTRKPPRIEHFVLNTVHVALTHSPGTLFVCPTDEVQAHVQQQEQNGAEGVTQAPLGHLGPANPLLRFSLCTLQATLFKGIWRERFEKTRLAALGTVGKGCLRADIEKLVL